eukprot:m.63825 g.63825  ORF g.63825 m.63825 type:complete len:380 (+) comp11462_c0_seq6:152-1291(+)
MQSQHNTYEDFEEFLDSPLAVKQMHDGRRISSVRLGHVIGSGAFGKVFTGTHSFTGDGVAVKQLPKPYSKETNICIRNEIEIMSRLSHPQIVLLYQIVETPTYTSIIMELGDCGTLRKWISEEILSAELIDSVFSSTTSAIAYLHSIHISHRDIKPENIFMTQAASPLLGDFGFAIDTAITPLSSQYCGSPLFCAPELLQSCEYIPEKVDLWALGILFVFMITGNYPLHPDDSKQWNQNDLEAIISETTTSQRQRQNWLRSLLQINPCDRHLPMTTQLTTILEEDEDKVGKGEVLPNNKETEVGEYSTSQHQQQRDIYNGREAVDVILKRRKEREQYLGVVPNQILIQHPSLPPPQTHPTPPPAFPIRKLQTSSFCTLL